MRSMAQTPPWRCLPNQRPAFYSGRRGAARILRGEAGGLGMPDFWLPLTSELLIDGATSRLKRPNGNFLDLIGRVHAGVDSKSLEAKVKVEFHDWLASHVPDMEPGEKQ